MTATELWVPPSVRETYKKAPPPKMGDAFGGWAGRDLQYLSMPGGAVLQFDLSRLTLADYRMMRDHYQINASLSVLSFMMHQLDWHIEADTAKAAEVIETNMRETWTRMIRALSQAFWAGYSPIAVEYENDVDGRTVKVSKFKDLVPEECRVNWKQVNGYAPPGKVPPKINVFDGIKQFGSSYAIPPENSLWYPLLMENGDYYGRKLLKPGFPSWFFSILIHLFSNRYFERFGEPVPIGRADFEDEVEVDGKVLSGRDAMIQMLTSLRNRSVVTLPSDRDDKGNYLWDIEYLESQMRGADFERYLYRLDEEMSLSIFTPTLLIRTADVGSYNLGVGHMQVYMWMLNALAGDLKEYIDRYVVTRIRDFNFGPKGPKAQWVPRKMGKDTVETYRAIVTELIRGGQAGVNLEELGEALGLEFHEIKQLTAPPADPANPPDPNATGDTQPGGNQPKPDQRPPRQRPSRTKPKPTP